MFMTALLALVSEWQCYIHNKPLLKWSSLVLSFFLFLFYEQPLMSTGYESMPGMHTSQQTRLLSRQHSNDAAGETSFRLVEAW